MRRSHSAKEKAEMVLEVIGGAYTLNEIASQNNVHPAMLSRWKTQALKGLPQIFESDAKKSQQQIKESENEKEELYKQIGKLTTQLEWLKKKSNH